MLSASGRPLRIGIVAAEPSGDLLAAGLMQSLQSRLSTVRFEGVAGPRMQRVGIDSWAPMESLSVMGVVEVLRHLPRLLILRARLLSRWRASPPDLFIGVDAPDFNLHLEQRMRQLGVPTIHYVSPTVWAWRTNRVKQIRRAVDRLLVLFPFETAFLSRFGINARYVGHRLSNDYPLTPDRAGAHARLGLQADRTTLALLPGSRTGEVRRLAPVFLETAFRLRSRHPDLQIVVPFATPQTEAVFDEIRRASFHSLSVHAVSGATQDVLAACDVALIASGTATFEALLSKRPMVVAYRVNPLTYSIVRLLRLVRVKHVALANLLSGEPLAPEYLQDRCTPDNLLAALSRFLEDRALRDRVVHQYSAIHRALQTDADDQAASGVIDLLSERGLV